MRYDGEQCNATYTDYNSYSRLRSHLNLLLPFSRSLPPSFPLFTNKFLRPHSPRSPLSTGFNRINDYNSSVYTAVFNKHTQKPETSLSLLSHSLNRNSIIICFNIKFTLLWLDRIDMLWIMVDLYLWPIICRAISIFNDSTERKNNNNKYVEINRAMEIEMIGWSRGVGKRKWGQRENRQIVRWYTQPV